MYKHWSSLKKLIWLYVTKFRSGGGGDKSNKVGYAIVGTAYVGGDKSNKVGYAIVGTAYVE